MDVEDIDIFVENDVECVDVLLLGGPEDGVVRRLEPSTTHYVLASAQDGARHTYFVLPFAGVEKVWHVGAHSTLMHRGARVDTIIAHLIALYVEKSAAKTEVPTGE